MPKKTSLIQKPNGKLKFKPAPPVERLEISLSADQTKELIRFIDDQKNDIDTHRDRFMERHQKYLFNWDDFITTTRKGPWADSSNLHMPLTAIMVKTYHARFYNIFTNENTTQLRPRENTDEGYAAIIQKLRYWYLYDYINNFRGIRGFAREIFYDMATVGFGIGMKDWVNQQRKIIIIEPNEAKELNREMADLTPQMQELTANTPELQTDEEMAETRMDISPYKEVQKIITVFEGSRLRALPWENCYFPNKIQESSNLDEPRAVLIETEMTEGQIRLKEKQQEWNKEAADTAINAGQQSYSGTTSQQLKEQRASLSGYEESSTLDTKSRIIQYCFVTYDIDDDGLDEELVVIKCGDKIMKTTYLERISRSGMRPLFKFDCFSKPRQAYSRGIPEFMWPLNEEIDLTHNKKQNALDLQTTPFGVYKATSSLKNQPLRISPGKLIPVDETTDIRLLSWPANATVLDGVEAQLWNYAERLASSSSLDQGIVPDAVGPLRSTSGVIALLKQMDKELKVSVDQCADQWKKMEAMLMDDLDCRVAMSTKFRILGPSLKDPERLMNAYVKGEFPDLLKVNARFDIEINVASAINSDEVRRNDSQILLAALSNPSIAQQLGVVGAKAMYRAWCDYLIAYGKDPADYIDKPFGDQAMTLFQEIQMCGQGEIPPMAIQDDHEQKAQMLIQFMQDPTYLEAKQAGVYVQNVDMVMQKAIKKHMMMAEMLQPKGMPNPSGANQPNYNEQMAGTAPQQGGPSANRTTSRQLNTQTPQSSPEMSERPAQPQQGEPA